jgi:hypothetical protein
LLFASSKFQLPMKADDTNILISHAKISIEIKLAPIRFKPIDKSVFSPALDIRWTDRNYFSVLSFVSSSYTELPYHNQDKS